MSINAGKMMRQARAAGHSHLPESAGTFIPRMMKIPQTDACRCMTSINAAQKPWMSAGQNVNLTI